ncbi:related to RO-10 protein, required for nuclear distribution [Cephalotrichum gorgonifer]|uniref:Related to RO-10 protein, required for nuclear distribution n=1 Tax=Cephalotrichum gorgonifer TaxID=2041049 RepID=A0AAE8MV61_9PEZI|nr:related to RO-10 protein, required for nuclear distribution [Cephalotrichum gorgonifer]
MDSSLDVTTIATLQLLESRLSQLELMVYGESPPNPSPAEEASVAWQLESLDRRFQALLSRVRVYNDLYKIYKTQPSLFDQPKPSEPPSHLPDDAIRAIVMASAPAFPAAEAGLRAVNDCPVPDVAQSAALISQMERMKAIEATQIAQAAEMAELRTQSERVIRRWYEGNALGASEFIADVESRASVVERAVRRAERVNAEALE